MSVHLVMEKGRICDGLACLMCRKVFLCYRSFRCEIAVRSWELMELMSGIGSSSYLSLMYLQST